MTERLDVRLLRRALGVTGLRIAFLGLWFVAITAAYRWIGALPDGVAQAGVLAFSLAAVKMFASAFSDPLDMDVVRRVPPMLVSDPEGAVAVWRAAQQIRLMLGAGVLALAVVLARPVAHGVLGDSAFAPMVVLAGAASALELIFRGYLSDMQSREWFGRFLVLEGSLQLLRIALLGGLVAVGALDARGFLIAYGLATFLMVGAGFVQSGAARRRLWVWSGPMMRDTWHYLRWVAPAMIIAAVVERLDLFVLTSLRGPTEAGLYGALLPLLLVPEVVVGFVMGVLQPRVADLHLRGALPGFWLSVCRLTVPVALMGALIVGLFAETVIDWTVGPAYLAAAPVLRILFVAAMAWFAVVPVALSFVVMTEPRATLAISILQAGVVALAGTALIPSGGAVGAAVAVLITRLATGAMVCGVAIWRLRGTPAGKMS